MKDRAKKVIAFEPPCWCPDSAGSEIGSMSICTDQRNQGNDKKKKDQVWIGDVRVGCVDKDAKGNNYRQSFV